MHVELGNYMRLTRASEREGEREGEREKERERQTERERVCVWGGGLHTAPYVTWSQASEQIEEAKAIKWGGLCVTGKVAALDMWMD